LQYVETDREFSASFDRLESATTKVSFSVSFPRIGSKTVSFFVSFLEKALRFLMSYLVSIVRGAPVDEGASVSGWLK
jgi:hypothetical protein